MGARFTSINEVMADLQDKVNKNSLDSSKQIKQHGADESICPKCKGKEWILYKDDHGYEVGRPCECREQRILNQRFESAMIPSEFEDARFNNYQVESEIQHLLANTIKAYLKLFKDTFDKKENRHTSEKPNLGFIAEVGEQRIRSLPSTDRSQIKHEKNSFGLGKTHLQVAAAKWLMRQGYNTLLVSDISLMDELMQARRLDDGSEMFNKLIGKVLNVNVLIWDDIGKSKPSEAKEGMYYKIINERYRANRPIVFSSNEDRGTLAERIGYAAASRLLGNCAENHLVECVGEDWRLKKEKV